MPFFMLSFISADTSSVTMENKIKCMPSTSNSLGKMQRRHQYHPNVCSHCKYGRKPCLYSQIKTKVLEIKFQREVWIFWITSLKVHQTYDKCVCHWHTLNLFNNIIFITTHPFAITYMCRQQYIHKSSPYEESTNSKKQVPPTRKLQTAFGFPHL